MTKQERIQFILDETRKAAKKQDPKSLERKLAAARIHLIKSTEAQVEALYDRVVKEGAAVVFGDKSNL